MSISRVAARSLSKMVRLGSGAAKAGSGVVVIFTTLVRLSYVVPPPETGSGAVAMDILMFVAGMVLYYSMNNLIQSIFN